MTKLLDQRRGRRLGIGIGAFLLVLLLSGTSIARFLQFNRLVSHSNEVVYFINELQMYSERVDTVARGFLLQRNSVVLPYFAQSKAGLFHALERLNELLADNPEQLERLKECER